MSKLIGYLAAAAIVAGAGALAVYLVSLAPQPERSEQPPQIPFVQSARVIAGVGAIPVHGAGTVRPSAEIEITTQVSGRVDWMSPSFHSGGRVKAGETIFRIEQADYLYRLREAVADLEDRKVALLEAEEQATVARTEYEQYSGRQLESESSVNLAGPLVLKEPQLKAAQAALKREEARVAQAKLALSRTRVKAPFDGYVREESVDIGQFLTVGQPVGRLFAADAVEVVVPLSDTNTAMIPGLWALQAGDSNPRVPARVKARYGDASYVWDGYVDRAEASLDKQTRTTDVIVRVPDPFSAGTLLDGPGNRDHAPPLLVGKFVEVEIRGLVPESYFRVPRSALQPGNEVWVTRDDQRVSIVPVHILQRGDDEVFVTGALEEGQAVVIGGIQFATEGMKVRTLDTMEQ
ncbi:MAG: efflux RND transporter periplasmic adaptor subunit [Gammaproteobacteria bacterium]|nr:efflux RND transporter periplasmic adaptor subunit [Gammaproteobacteria bacterium]